MSTEINTRTPLLGFTISLLIRTKPKFSKKIKDVLILCKDFLQFAYWWLDENLTSKKQGAYMKILVIFLLLLSSTCHALERIGPYYGGWTIPSKAVNKDSIVYLAGVGEDVTFEVGLIARYGCHAHSFDPTPRAVEHIKQLFHSMKMKKPIMPTPKSKPYTFVENLEEKLHFHPFGLWDENTELKFYAPRNPKHVSHSALNLQKTTKYFMAPCRRLRDVMQELGHDHIDLLKLDIEGAEYRVLASILDDDLDVKVICVEFDEFAGVNRTMNSDIQSSLQRVNAIVKRLKEHGYSIAYKKNWTEVLFVKN